MTGPLRTLRLGVCRLLVLVTGMAHIGAAPCETPAVSASAQPTAVQVVWGPLDASGDPRVVHHLEHVLLNEHPDVACLTGAHGVLEAYTGPDTLHLLWRGLADSAGADAVAETLRSMVDPLPMLQVEYWTEAGIEIAAEAALHEPSAHTRLRQQNSRLGDRYRLETRGPVRFDPDMVARALYDAPVTAVIAMHTAPIRWTRSTDSSTAPASIRTIEHPSGADLAWTINGTLDCTQRRALWATLTGLATVRGGSVVGWMGHSYGVVGLVELETRRASRRQVLEAARAHDRAMTRATTRRATDPADRTWLGVGHLGLGVCPSLPDHPLTEADLQAALGWWMDRTQPEPGVAIPPEGALILEPQPRAALWQAGAAPAGWDAHPELRHRRTPGGFGLEGTQATLMHLRAAGDLPIPGPQPTPPDTPTEQALVLAGARVVSVPCRWSGIESVPECPSPGSLRAPSQDALYVIDHVEPPGFVRVDVVYALDTDTVRRAADALLGTGGSIRAGIDEIGTVRDVRVVPEHARTQLSFTVPNDQLTDILKAVLIERRDTPGVGGQHPIGAALDRAREAARPDQRAHHPDPASDALVDAQAVADFDRSPRVVVLHGSPSEVQTALDALGLHPDRILSPHQLRAEAESIRGP